MQSSQRIFVLCCLLCCCWKQICGQDFNPLPRSQRPPSAGPAITPRSLTPDIIRQAFQTADVNVAQERRSIIARGRPMDPRTDAPSFRHNMFQRSRPRTQQLENRQLRFEEATRVLASEQNLTPNQANTALANMDLANVLGDGTVEDCERLFNFTCNPTERYRTFDGTCNNLANPSWGMAGSCFQRLVGPVYDDGISEMRRAASGRELPRPRRISLEIHSHMDRPTDYVTHMFMQWGQFLDHDISLSPLEQNENVPLSCCPPEDNDPQQCGPILLDQDDPFYAAFGIDCLNNARTVICSSCRMGGRQQTNQLTHFIDGSMIYDLSSEDADGLRNRDGSGTLRSLNSDNGGELLPPNNNPNVEDGCSFQMQEQNCFVAGCTERIEALRPKSPPPKNKGSGGPGSSNRGGNSRGGGGRAKTFGGRGRGAHRGR